MLDHPLGANTLNMVTRCLAQQLINAVPKETGLTDAVGTDQGRNGDAALRQPPRVLQGGSGCLDVGRDDPVPQQRRVAIQLGNVALDHTADVRCQLDDSGFQARCNRGDSLPNPSITDIHTPIIDPAAMPRTARKLTTAV